MAERVALLGGNEFRPLCRPADQTVLRRCGEPPIRVAIVPTAAGRGARKSAADGVAYFRSLGADPFAVMVVDRAAAEEHSICAALNSADLVYFPGGDPRYLLETLQLSLAWRVITTRHDAGAWIAGSSAGAMVLGSFMALRPQGWSPGLNLLCGVAVVAHTEGRAIANLIGLRAGLDPDVVLLALDAQTSCVHRPDGGWDVIGPGAATIVWPDHHQCVPPLALHPGGAISWILGTRRNDGRRARASATPYKHAFSEVPCLSNHQAASF